MNVLQRRTVGSAIQRGLMMAAGYFDDEHWKNDPYPPDWAVTSFRERATETVVEGFNLNCAPGEYGHRFEWRFSNGKAFNDWRYRFELCSGAEGAS